MGFKTTVALAGQQPVVIASNGRLTWGEAEIVPYSFKLGGTKIVTGVGGQVTIVTPASSAVMINVSTGKVSVDGKVENLTDDAFTIDGVSITVEEEKAPE